MSLFVVLKKVLQNFLQNNSENYNKRKKLLQLVFSIEISRIRIKLILISTSNHPTIEEICLESNNIGKIFVTL